MGARAGAVAVDGGGGEGHALGHGDVEARALGVGPQDVVWHEEEARGERHQRVRVGDQRGPRGRVQDVSVCGEAQRVWRWVGEREHRLRAVFAVRDRFGHGGDGGGAGAVEEVQDDHEVAAVDVGRGAGHGERDGYVVGLGIFEIPAVNGSKAVWVLLISTFCAITNMSAIYLLQLVKR